MGFALGQNDGVGDLQHGEGEGQQCAADGQQGRLFIGFAAAELLGLLAFVVAMILIFVA